MKEIDFDELDKAITSALEAERASQTTTGFATAVTPSLTPAPETSAPTTATPKPVKRAQQLHRATATEKRKQVMDVIHPTVNNRTKSPRAQRTIQEVVTTLPPAPTTPAPKARQAAPAPVPTAQPADEIAVRFNAKAQSNRDAFGDTPAPAPDTITQHTPSDNGNLAEQMDALLSNPTPVATPEPSTPVPETLPPETTTPSTPFLMNAAVEKRPLNNAPDRPVRRAPQPTLATSLDEPLATLPPETPVPEVEHDTPAPETSAPETKPPAPRVLETDQPAYQGPVSIPRQYKEPPRKPEDVTGSVYDTESYHAPIEAKQESSKASTFAIVGVILAIVALIVVVVVLNFLLNGSI